MATYSDSASRAGPERGLFGVCARWVASQGGLLAAKLSNFREQERTLECLNALNIGLQVCDDRGRQLFSNRINENLRDNSHPTASVMRLADTTPYVNGSRLLHSSDTGSNGVLTKPPLRMQPHVVGPDLQELPGNRWVNVYSAFSAAGHLAVARVDVTDTVRRCQDLEERVRQLMWESSTDGLTGLANRRHFDATLATEWSRAARGQTSIGLLMVDIDHFKKYNDHYGHHAGDRCLQKVATVLAGCVRRAGELVARYGGEEFVLLLPGSDEDEACETAQKCVDGMRDAALEHVACSMGNAVTLSIGVASIQPKPISESVTMLKAADAAMYRAKVRARTRYEVANQDDWNIADDTPRSQ